MLKKNNAFTISEFIMSLIVIGIIAAMTIPSIVSVYTERAAIVTLKKYYSTLSNAYVMLQREFGSYEDWAPKTEGHAQSRATAEKLEPYLKIAKKCDVNTPGCWAKTLDLSKKGYTAYAADYGNGSSGVISYRLQDGVNICLDLWSPYTDIWGIKHETKTDARFLVVYVDTNGDKKPNAMGHDVFAFVFTDQRGLLPSGADSNRYCNRKSGGGKESFSGYTCTAKALREGAINY